MTDRRRLRRAAEGDDRQVFAACVVLNVQFQSLTGPTADGHARSGAGRSTWPTRTRLVPRIAARGMAAMVDLVGRGTFQRQVRAGAVVATMAEITSPHEGANR